MFQLLAFKINIAFFIRSQNLNKILTLKQRLASHHNIHQNTRTKHIHFTPLPLILKNLRRNIPRRPTLLKQIFLFAHLFTQPKICKHYLIQLRFLPSQQNILRFNIPMHNSFRMQVL